MAADRVVLFPVVASGCVGVIVNSASLMKVAEECGQAGWRRMKMIMMDSCLWETRGNETTKFSSLLFSEGLKPYSLPMLAYPVFVGLNLFTSETKICVFFRPAVIPDINRGAVVHPPSHWFAKMDVLWSPSSSQTWHLSWFQRQIVTASLSSEKCVKTESDCVKATTFNWQRVFQTDWWNLHACGGFFSTSTEFDCDMFPKRSY